MILGVNPGHDGAIAAIKDRQLLFSWEAEQDSHPRHMPAAACFLLNAMAALDDPPAVIARSGWHRDDLSYESPGLPYHGIDHNLVRVRKSTLLGRPVIQYESTHERSHIFCSYGLSPFPQGQPCYALVWEGEIGSFYELDERLNVIRYGPVVQNPGYKYSFLFDLADPTVSKGTWRLDTAGKLMALAGFATPAEASAQERDVIERIFREVNPPTTAKGKFAHTPYFNCGVTEPRFRNLVARFSDALFDRFYSYAKTHLRKGLPLLIGGGCGLNCEWNSRWRDCGLFTDVFVPPVTNDSGVAIGTAIEAQFSLSGSAKISWSVYSGLHFVWDGCADGFVEKNLDYDYIADLLLQDKVVAWVQGRSEIGPRALGNRSLLASPFKRATKDRLNEIKQREPYRPIAPICLEEDALRLFGLQGKSPHMLYFQPSCAPELQAVTHVDGSARVQTVSRDQNPALYELLSVFKRRTGFGVLCNTSLNRKGKGFLNRSSELFAFAQETGLDALVIDARFYVPAVRGARARFAGGMS
jgi:predicted NodU family carbamoyl transferase